MGDCRCDSDGAGHPRDLVERHQHSFCRQSTPYPLSLVVSGLPGSVTHLRVRLNGLAHSWPGDIGALLVSPDGQRVMLMSGAWDNPVTATPVSLTFADGAPQPPMTGAPVTGTYRPTNYRGATLPGVPGPYRTALAALNGTDPNGTWSLYVFDFVSGLSGTISGYSLIFSNASSDDYVASSGTLTFSRTARRRRPSPCPSLVT